MARGLIECWRSISSQFPKVALLTILGTWREYAPARDNAFADLYGQVSSRLLCHRASPPPASERRQNARSLCRPLTPRREWRHCGALGQHGTRNGFGLQRPKVGEAVQSTACVSVRDDRLVQNRQTFRITTAICCESNAHLTAHAAILAGEAAPRSLNNLLGALWPNVPSASSSHKLF